MKKFFLVLSGILFGIIAAEFLVRLIKPAPTIYPISVTSENGDHALSMNEKLIYVPKPNTGEFNAKGYRGRVFSADRPAHKKRAVFIGDSVLEGLNIKAGMRFTDLLMIRLGSDYEMINLGVRGYNLAQEFEYFKEFGIPYQGDVVLFCVTFNDLDLSAGEITELTEILKTKENSGFFNAYYTHKSNLHKLLLKSHIYRYFSLFISGKGKKSPENKNNFFNSVYYRMRDEEINQILDDFLQLSQSRHFKPVFVFLPLPPRTKSADLLALRDRVRRKNIAIIDLFDYVNKHYEEKDRNKLFLDFCHLSRLGHKVVADILFKEIVPLFR